MVNLRAKPTHPGSPSVKSQGQGKTVPQKRQLLKPRHSIQPPANEGRGTKLPQPSDSTRRKIHVPASLQRSKKHKHDPPVKPSSPTPPEDCISHLPVRNSIFKKDLPRDDKWPNGF